MTKNNKKVKINSKKRILLGVLIVVLLAAVLGLSYAWLHQTKYGQNSLKLEAGSLDIIYDNDANSKITLQNAVPMSDTKGLESTPYTFSIKNNGTSASNFIIYLDDLALSSGDTRISDGYLKYSLSTDENDKHASLLSSLATTTNSETNLISRTLVSDTIAKDATLNYSLRIWVSSDAPNSIMNTKFKEKIRIINTQVVQ